MFMASILAPPAKSFSLDETLTGCDVDLGTPRPRGVPPEMPAENAGVDAWLEYHKAQADQERANEWIADHYPGYYKEEEGDARFDSIPYLAVITLGSTGWSGFSNETGNWLCRFDDLTPEGQALYRTIEALYGPHGTLVLQTWLDT